MESDPLNAGEAPEYICGGAADRSASVGGRVCQDLTSATDRHRERRRERVERRVAGRKGFALEIRDLLSEERRLPRDARLEGVSCLKFGVTRGLNCPCLSSNTRAFEGREDAIRIDGTEGRS